MAKRGELRNPEYRHIRDFTNLCWGRITPSDVDAFVEFDGKLFVFIEAKFGDAQMPRGQQLALERLADACWKPPARSSLLIICRHGTEATVDYAAMPVERLRWAGEWQQIERMSVAQVIERARKFSGIKGANHGD